MTTLNQGRNEIRVNNSNAGCLLENWVEERAVANLDRTQSPKAGTAESEEVAQPTGRPQAQSSTQAFKDGHLGLLTTEFEQKAEDKTTFRVSYTPPKGCNVRQRGIKSELLERALYEQVSREVDAEFNPSPEPPEYKSVTHQDFNIDDFQSIKKAPTATHNYVSDQPVTFWTEHREKIHGTTQNKTHDSVFRKNDAFSKPTGEYWDEPQPYEHDLIPNM